MLIFPNFTMGRSRFSLSSLWLYRFRPCICAESNLFSSLTHPWKLLGLQFQVFQVIDSSSWNSTCDSNVLCIIFNSTEPLWISAAINLSWQCKEMGRESVFKSYIFENVCVCNVQMHYFSCNYKLHVTFENRDFSFI